MSRNLTILLERAVRIRRLIGNELRSGGESQLRLLRLRRLLLLLEHRLQHAWCSRTSNLVAIPATVGTRHQSRRFAR